MKKSRELGFSVNSINSILKDDKWVDIYKNEFMLRSGVLKSSYFKDGLFEKILKSELEISLKDEISDDPYYIRSNISKWMQIAHLKSFSLFKLVPLVNEQLDSSLKVYKEYQDVPLGPQDKNTLDALNKDAVAKWRDGNLLIFFSEASINNILGLYISELFFSAESMLRIICIGSCIEFSIKAILPNHIIQHEEIHKTLRKLAKEESEKVSCRLCKMNPKCPRMSSYLDLANIYEIIYHLRVLKDYKREFYFNNSLTDFFITIFIAKGLDIIFILDEIIQKIYSNYLMSPYSLRNFYKRAIQIKA